MEMMIAAMLVISDAAMLDISMISVVVKGCNSNIMIISSFLSYLALAGACKYRIKGAGREVNKANQLSIFRGSRGEVRRMEKENQINMGDKDLHCAARIIQSALFADSIFYGCNFCKYKNECFAERIPGDMYFDKLREKLQGLTGIDIGPCYDSNNPETKFKNYQS